MKTQVNILIEKDDSGYIGYCPAIAGYKVTAQSLELVIDKLKITISNYLEQNTSVSEANSNKPITHHTQAFSKLLEQREPVSPDFDTEKAKEDYLLEKYNL